MSMATISKWGNARAVRIPKMICEEINLHEGDTVNLTAKDNRIIIEKPDEDHSIRNLMKDWDGVRYSCDECDWGEPCGSEMW